MLIITISFNNILENFIYLISIIGLILFNIRFASNVIKVLKNENHYMFFFKICFLLWHIIISFIVNNIALIIYYNLGYF